MVRRIDAASRLEAEAIRIAKIKEDARVPDDLAHIIPDAPARGSFYVIRPVLLVPNGAHAYVPTSARSRVMLVADVFDRMAHHARRRERACPVTVSQVSVARDYRNLVERYSSAGCPKSCLDDSQSGGDGVGVSVALADASRRIAQMQRRIGSGVAKVVRRQRGMAKRPITDRVLVDAVCVADKDITAVARDHGWSDDSGRVKGEVIKVLTAALVSALDRMSGPVRSGAGCHTRTDVPPVYASYAVKSKK